jgi:hypothetical protein
MELGPVGAAVPTPVSLAALITVRPAVFDRGDEASRA